MSERFAFYNTKVGSQIGRKLHDGDDAMDEAEAERVLNDLWNSYKDSIERIAALEKERDFILSKVGFDNGGFYLPCGNGRTDKEESIKNIKEALKEGK